MYIKRENQILFTDITEARTFWQRFMGLMGKKKLDREAGLWFENCSSIHCFFMKIPIDVVYCDRNYRVVGIETVQPWHIGHRYRGAAHVLEVNAGSASQIRLGDVLQLERKEGERNGR